MSFPGDADMNRMTTRAVTFHNPFRIEGWHPAGRYILEMEDERLQALSFPAWRRVYAAMRIPRRPGGPKIEQLAVTDEAEINAALAGDIAAR
jgi:hypothetical protein